MIQADDKNRLILDEFMMRDPGERAERQAVSREAKASEEGRPRIQGHGGAPRDITVSLDAGPSPAELLL